ncbi:MAG TPA: acetate/propionate family kinase [Candidatus Binatia bacterium]|nr:acetate/propionate family kinase [Candidatus Binatia bacterium]
MSDSGNILAINGGSSSVKFGLYSANGELRRQFSGKVDRIGFPDASLTFAEAGKQPASAPIDAPNHAAGATILMDRVASRLGADAVAAIGHRVVHGGPKYSDPQRITPEVLDELRRLSPYDPEHLPAEIRLIEAFAERYPRLPQVACFDTAFHRDMPRAARILPIPRRYEAKGVYRYGFHGLSYAYLLEELGRVAGTAAANGRVILAHLGNGASIAAVRDGKCIDTTMAFTPAAGLPMSTRSGDLDPGLVWYLARSEGMTAEQFNRMVNNESGLLGVSEISSDMRDLLKREDQDVRAAEAVALFCYQAKKWIGAFAAALGGLETLVFAGGIGENAAVVRERICAGLDFLGLNLAAEANRAGAPVISTAGSLVAVRVMRTDEEVMIARAVRRTIQ